MSSGPSYTTHTKILIQKTKQTTLPPQYSGMQHLCSVTKPGFHPQHYQKYIQMTASTDQISVYLGVYETLIAYLMKLLWGLDEAA